VSEDISIEGVESRIVDAGRIGILSFLPSRLKVAFLSPLPYLSLTISVRLLKQPGYKSMMVRGSGFITFVTR